MEKGKELYSGAYEADFRMVDCRIGRWFSADPVKKHWESPYAGFSNNPVYFVDPSGLDPTNAPSGGGDDKKNPKSGGREGDKVKVESHKEENCENCYNGEVIDYVLTKDNGGSPGTGSNSGSGQKRSAYVKGGYNDSPYRINRGENSMPSGRINGPIYNNHWEKTFMDVSEGFSKRMASNMSLGATSVSMPVYEEDDDAETRRNKAMGAILADVLSIEIGAAEIFGGGLGELASFGLGSAVFLPVIAHGAGVIVTSGAALYTDVQMLFTVDAVVTDTYHEGHDEGGSGSDGGGGGGGSNLEKIKDNKWLEKKIGDIEEFKKEYVGSKGGSFDVFKDKGTGELWLVDKKGKAKIPTNVFIDK